MATNISTLSIDATKSEVWDALTKPELVKLWQYGSELVTNWEVECGCLFQQFVNIVLSLELCK